MNRPFPLRLAMLLPAVGLLASGCLGLQPDGTAATPAAPTQGASSRLPQLLQQLQGGSGAGLELFDAPANQVLAAQDQQGKFTDTVTPSATATATTSLTATPRATPTSIALNPGRTPTPTATASPSSTFTPTPTSTPTGTVTPTATPTPTPTPTPTTPATPPSEGTPPTEG